MWVLFKLPINILYEEVLEECRKSSETANSLVTSSYKEEILDLDISMLKVRFNENYNSFLRFLNSQYRKDCKLLRSYSRTNERTKYKIAVELIEKIDDAQKKRAALDEQTAKVNEL